MGTGGCRDNTEYYGCEDCSKDTCSETLCVGMGDNFSWQKSCAGECESFCQNLSDNGDGDGGDVGGGDGDGDGGDDEEDGCEECVSIFTPLVDILLDLLNAN